MSTDIKSYTSYSRTLCKYVFIYAYSAWMVVLGAVLVSSACDTAFAQGQVCGVAQCALIWCALYTIQEMHDLRSLCFNKHAVN